MKRASTYVLGVLLAISISAAEAGSAEPDILFADFEGETYGGWNADGDAFGDRPAAGTLPDQMPVTGFLGRGLVNSYRGGDRSTGTLASPEFVISRRYIAFLIGGGGHEGETCLDLVVDGAAVRSAVGPNTQPGGSEELQKAGWDVSDLVGRRARLVVVDKATGGWGHINVDHIVFTDVRPPLPRIKPQREILAAHRLLHFPVKNGAAKRRVAVLAGGRVVREFEIELAHADADWWAPLDISAWHGKRLLVQVDQLPAESQALDALTQSDLPRESGPPYSEPLRPQLHFSPRRGWNNDPNGMVFADGEYHLFFQHNPYGVQWGNMHWGHAVSKDLVHWEELPIAIYPAKFGDWAFSGSAAVDRQNTSLWRKNDRGSDLIVAAFTSTGRGECITFSQDGGRTWTEFEGNPVVRHNGRDPKLLWHEPTRRWVMALYDEHEGKRWIAFHASADLKKWEFQSRIEGFFECPDLFELPVDGDQNNRKWVLTAADSDYMIGAFDGAKFTPETPKLKGQRGRGFYAAQVFNNQPQGRVVQMGWFQAASPGMPFNQAMTVPLELRLAGTVEGPRLAWRPVKELEKLRAKTHVLGPLLLKANENPLADIQGELLEIQAEFKPAGAAEVALNVRGVPIVYDAANQELRVGDHAAPAPLREGVQRLAILVDRTGLEIFASDGLVYVPMPVIPKADVRTLAVEARGGQAEFQRLEVHQLKSIWKK